MKPQEGVRKVSLPKHASVRETLRHRIADGTYPVGVQLPSEQDLPRQLKVGKNTVVRALNDLAREGLIVRRRGSGSYVADAHERPLIPNRFLRLGVLLPYAIDPEFYREDSLYRDILFGVLRALGVDRVQPVFPRVKAGEATRGIWTSNPCGCCVEVLGSPEDLSRHNPPLESVRAASLDAILTLSIFDEEWLAKVLDLGLPTVLVDYPGEGFAFRADQVFFDPFPGYRATVRAMVARNLHRIHFVGCWAIHYRTKTPAQAGGAAAKSLAGGQPDPDTFLRKAAWRQAMDEAGLDCPGAWAHTTMVVGARLQALAEQLAALPEDERPQAVVCHSIEQAEVFLDVFRARGYPLEAAGATHGRHRHTAWPIFSDPNELGGQGARLLLIRLLHPKTSFLRVGVTMGLSGYVPTSQPPIRESL